MSTHRLPRHPLDITLDVLLVVGRFTLRVARFVLVLMVVYVVAAAIAALVNNK